MTARVRPQPMPLEEEVDDPHEEVEEVVVQTDESEVADETTQGGKPKNKRRKKTVTKVRVWKIDQDINYDPLPPFQNPPIDRLREPSEYFLDMFSPDLIEDIVYQTNLYVRQKDVSSTFQIDRHEFVVFLGIIIYMGVCDLPAIEDYWAAMTKVPNVSECMSAKRFRLIRSVLHFNNNEHARASTDRFYKIRPVFNALTKQFQKIKETPTQSVDEVMVAYKGTRAGNLRQYIQNKPDKWGFKLFCRASIDGIIHDILMYQGEPTFTSHHTQLTEAESKLLTSTKTVICLAKTIKKPDQSAIYADNYFTSIGLVEYLKTQYGCRYVGTARVSRIGKPPLMDAADFDDTPRGTIDFCTSEGILALRWKDNKVVTVLSTDIGISPAGEVKRFNNRLKKKVDIACPGVIKEYNGKMGGIDKSDMLTHLYKTPMRARRWYIRLFGYAVDLCICNAWLCYKRDCVALNEKPMPLKIFRLDISRFARCQQNLRPRVTRLSSNPGAQTPPQRGQRAIMPTLATRFDPTKLHLPKFVPNRQTCKHCSTKGDIHRSRWICTVCKVALCLSDNRNCFEVFHKPDPTIHNIVMEG